MVTIQLGHPKIKKVTTTEYASVKDAFLKLFRAKEEVLYLFWYDIPICMRYQQDIPLSFDSILAMIWLMKKEEQGKTLVTLTTELFTITMKLHWEGAVVDVVTKFEAHSELYSVYANELNKHEYSTVYKEAFINEWNTLLRQLLIVLTAGEITIKEGSEKRKLELFQKSVNEMETYGRLYTK